MSSTEVKMTIDPHGKLIISVSVGDSHVPIGEMRQTAEGPQFTSDNMTVWITPEILQGIAILMQQVDDGLNVSGVIH